MSRKKKQPNFHYNQLMNDYRAIALSMFEWSGLPDDMPIYIPEKWLYEQGQCCALKLPGTDEMSILPVSYGSERLDIYGNPQEWRAYAIGDSAQAEIIRNTKLNKENSVLIWNNNTRTGDEPYISTIVNKMVELDKTLDENCLVQRTPFLIAGNQKNILTARNVMNDISDGKQFLMDMGMNIAEAVQVINLNVPFIGSELSDQYETYHNRILRYLAIDHLPVEKQERMLTGEASGNDDEIEIRKRTRLEYRQDSVDKINDLFGMSLEVNYVEPEPDLTASPLAMYGASASSTEAGGLGKGSGQEHS